MKGQKQKHENKPIGNKSMLLRQNCNCEKNNFVHSEIDKRHNCMALFEKVLS